MTSCRLNLQLDMYFFNLTPISFVFLIFIYLFDLQIHIFVEYCVYFMNILFGDALNFNKDIVNLIKRDVFHS